jgi:hypothetical protein
LLLQACPKLTTVPPLPQAKKTTGTAKALMPGGNITHFGGARKMLEQMLHKHNACPHGAMLKWHRADAFLQHPGIQKRHWQTPRVRGEDSHPQVR